MSYVSSGFFGLSTIKLSTHSDFSKKSELLAQHESLYLHGHDDIAHLLSRKVELGQTSGINADKLMDTSHKLFPNGSVDEHRQGSTFVPINDVIHLHLAQSHEEHNQDLISVVNDNDEIIQCRRAWSQIINIVQMEDSRHYGFQFRSVSRIAPNGKAGMMTWSLCSILSSVKELWQAVDTKPNPFQYRGWEAWMLSFIQSDIFSFDTVRRDKRSPFKKITSFSEIIDKVNRFAPIHDDRMDPRSIFNFSIEFMRRLFTPREHPSISITSSVLDVLNRGDDSHYDNTSIIILVGSGLPEEIEHDDIDNSGRIVLEDGVAFELRSVVLLRVEDEAYSYREDTPHKFDAVRYMRHGGHYSSW